MRGCPSGAVTQIRVGIQRMGIIDLPKAINRVAEEGITDPDAVSHRLITELSPGNHFSDPADTELRLSLLREFKRARGEDVRPFFSSIDVEVRGAPGPDRERFVEMAISVFGLHEFSPRITFTPADGEGPCPQLIVRDEVIVRGTVMLRSFKSAVTKSLTHW